jgi:hypothetical protein
MPKVMRGQSPASVAWAMYAPNPVAVKVVCPQLTISETMLAFQAPPLAVIPPVTQEEKMPGIINFCHNFQPCKPTFFAISRKSVGMLIAPAMELKRMYHCAPRDINKILPKSMLMLARMKNRVAKGKIKLAGNDAKNCTTGCNRRANLGLKPMGIL